MSTDKKTVYQAVVTMQSICNKRKEEITFRTISKNPFMKTYHEDIIDLKEAEIKNALIKMGWTPPKEDGDYMSIEKKVSEQYNKLIDLLQQEIINNEGFIACLYDSIDISEVRGKIQKHFLYNGEKVCVINKITELEKTKE